MDSNVDIEVDIELFDAVEEVITVDDVPNTTTTQQQQQHDQCNNLNNIHNHMQYPYVSSNANSINNLGPLPPPPPQQQQQQQQLQQQQRLYQQPVPHTYVFVRSIAAEEQSASSAYLQATTIAATVASSAPITSTLTSTRQHRSGTTLESGSTVTIVPRNIIQIRETSQSATPCQSTITGIPTSRLGTATSTSTSGPSTLQVGLGVSTERPLQQYEPQQMSRKTEQATLTRSQEELRKVITAGIDPCGPEATSRRQFQSDAIIVTDDVIPEHEPQQNQIGDLEPKSKPLNWSGKGPNAGKRLKRLISLISDSLNVLKSNNPNKLLCHHADCIGKRRSVRPLQNLLLSHCIFHLDRQIYYCSPCNAHLNSLHYHINSKHYGHSAASLLEQGVVKDLRPQFEDELITILGKCFPTTPQSRFAVGSEHGSGNSEIHDSVGANTADPKEVHNKSDILHMALVERRQNLGDGEVVYCKHPDCMKTGHYIKKLRGTVVPSKMLLKHITYHFHGHIYYCSVCKLEINSVYGHLQKHHPGQKLANALRTGIIMDLRPIVAEELISILDQCFPSVKQNKFRTQKPKTKKYGNGAEITKRTDKLQSALVERRQNLGDGEVLHCQHPDCLKTGHTVRKLRGTVVSSKILLKHISHHYNGRLYYCSLCKVEINHVYSHLTKYHPGQKLQSALTTGIVIDLRPSVADELIAILNQCFPSLGPSNSKKGKKNRRKTNDEEFNAVYQDLVTVKSL